VSAEAPRPARSPRPCPICERPADPKFRPFCSARCADVDLGRWLTGQYAIPAEDDGAPPDDRDA
jgi:uncharacterized protein